MERLAVIPASVGLAEGDSMRPKERRDSGQNDLFRARLDQIVDLDHALAKLGRAIDWRFLEQRFGAVYTDKVGHPPLPTRLMAGLSILKHMHNLSDEDLCARWVENPYYQLFCGEEFFQHRLVFDRSSLTRWRQRMAEEKLAALVQESLASAIRMGAARPADFTQVIVDTTVQEKAISFPTDARLMHRARERLVRFGAGERHQASPVLCAGGQVRPDQAPALRPCETVQTREQGSAPDQNPAGPRYPRYQAQDR